jgi:hypothetical protein
MKFVVGWQNLYKSIFLFQFIKCTIITNFPFVENSSKQLNNAPLMTSQLRKQQEEERRQQLFAKYPTTLLRIQFPDSLILQLPLPTMSTISEV